MIADAGFVDAGAARAAVRRMKLRGLLREVSFVNAALLDRLNHRAEADYERATSLIERWADLAKGDGEGAIGRQPVDLVEGKDVREQQLLEGVDAILQLYDTLLDGLRHGLFTSTAGTEGERTAAQFGAHRLCGDAK